MLKINNNIFGGDIFYNGEVIYKKMDISEENNEVELVFEGNHDIGNLQIAATYIKKEKPNAKMTLVMKYIPYSRMDREINEQIFSLEIFAELINNMGFDKVYVLDPHSGVSEGLIKNLELLDINEYIYEAIEDFKPDLLFFPDKGAMAKYPDRVKACSGDNAIPYFYGNKVRDLNDKGKIIKYDIITNGMEIRNKRVLIIDDICCKGGTFIWAAEEMKKLGVGSVGLYVSHCENSIFEGDIFKTNHIEQVYTSNSLNLKIKVIGGGVRRDRLKN